METKTETEREITKEIRGFLNGLNIFHWKQWQGRFSKHGISDIIGLLPGGRFLAIEIKRPGNKPSEAQIKFLREIKEQGGIAILAYSVEQVEDALRDEGF